MKKNYLKKVIQILFMLGFVVLAFDTYGKIIDLEKTLIRMDQSLDSKYQNEEEIPQEERISFNREVSDYYKWRNTVQCFWVEYVIDLEEFDYLRF